MKLTKDELFLLTKAKEAAAKAYAPYSGYKVGAALMTEAKAVYCGCNVENASYSLTLCAERNAIMSAVCRGERKFITMVVYVDSNVLFTPCGACRQVMAEFSQNMKIIFANKKELRSATVKELLPDSFSLKDT